MEAMYQFLHEHKLTAYSTTTLAHKFGLKRGQLNHTLDTDDEIRRVNPLEVGSVNVYCAK